MIHTCTPNPALDLGGMVEKIVPNEKNYVFDETRYPGGNAINVARILSGMGIPVRATGFLGGGIGDEIASLLDEEGVGHEFIRIQGHTRVSVTVSSMDTHKQTRLSFPGPTIRLEESARMLDYVRELRAPAMLVVGGSLPPGYPVEAVGELIRAAHERNVPVIADLPGKYLRSVVDSWVCLIKPNLTEFQELLGREVRTIGQVLEAASAFEEKVPLICVSSVEGGAVLRTPIGSWFGKGPRIHPRSTVGAGDSMVGAMTGRLWSTGVATSRGLELEALTDATIEEIFRWGIAAAMATLTTPGTQLGRPDEMRSFCDRIEIKKIS